MDGINLTQQQLSTLAKKLKISEDDLKKQASAQEESNSAQQIEAGSVGVNDREGSLAALDAQALMNAMLVNNKADEEGGKTYTFNKSKKSQTIVVNGQQITVTATVSGNNSLKIVVGKDGKINVYSDGATAINFSKATKDLNINIEKSTANLTVTGGSGNDMITVQEGAKVAKIDGGKGDDVIVNAGADYSGAQIIGGTGNDMIFNASKASKIDGGAGNDDIFNFGTVTNITGGAGNDNITNYGNVTTKIDAGAGNDRIDNLGTAKQIAGGSGTDTVGAKNGAKVNSVEKYEDGIQADGRYYKNGELFSGTLTSTEEPYGQKRVETYENGLMTNLKIIGQLVNGKIANDEISLEIIKKYDENGQLIERTDKRNIAHPGSLFSGIEEETQKYSNGQLSEVTTKRIFTVKHTQEVMQVSLLIKKFENGKIASTYQENSPNGVLQERSQTNYKYDENGDVIMEIKEEEFDDRGENLKKCIEKTKRNGVIVSCNVDGKPANGVVDDIYYKEGKPANGFVDEVLCFKGKPVTGIYTENGKDTFYYEGKPFSGYLNGKPYLKGKEIVPTSGAGLAASLYRYEIGLMLSETNNNPPQIDLDEILNVTSAIKGENVADDIERILKRNLSKKFKDFS